MDGSDQKHRAASLSKSGEPLRATLKLARWEARQTFWLLLTASLSVMLTVVLFCAIPFYAQIAINAGIHDALNGTGDGPYMTVSSISMQLSASHIDELQQEITQRFRNSMGSSVQDMPQFSVQMTDIPLLTSPYYYPNSQINLIGESMQSAASHLRLLQGRLPRTTSQGRALEIAVLPETAKALHATIGSTLTAQVFEGDSLPSAQQTVVFHIVGIFALPAQTDLYWHRQDFRIAQIQQCWKPCVYFRPPPLFQALVPNTALINTFGSLTTSTPIYGGGFQTSYISSPQLFWYYALNSSQITIDTLNRVITGMKGATDSLLIGLNEIPYAEQTQAIGPYSSLLTYQNYIAVLQVPTVGLTALLLGLLLYVTSIMMHLLTEHQSPSLAILRSRGASSRQILSLFVIQASGFVLVALLAGSALSLLAVRLLVQTTLPPQDQGAFTLLFAEPGMVALQLLVSATIAAVIVFLAIVMALYRATRLNIVTLRRETARATRVPFWRRAKLDLIAVVLAIAGYVAIIYITNPGVLDTRTRVLILAPLTLVAALCLLVGATLLFLRSFPIFLNIASRLVLRSRGAAPTLALAQMARAPQQPIRAILLLAFATAFVLFSLIFSSSQTQRIQDEATYQVGSDFSADVTRLYQVLPSSAFSSLPGVAAASTGYAATNAVVGPGTMSVALLAVDARTFAQATIWQGSDSPQHVTALMAKLVEESASASTVVPAVVDAAAWQNLHLSVGTEFTLRDASGDLTFVAVGEVQHIPTVIDTTISNNTGDSVLAGGIVTDFPTYNRLAATNGVSYTTTTAWVKAQDTPQAVALVRRELVSLEQPHNATAIIISDLQDRRAIAATLLHDPLSVALLELLQTGAVAILLLALISNLITSWRSARDHLLHFSVLRALGSSRRQIASALLWEQGIIYMTGLVLGVLIGILLALLTLPGLVFTSVGSGVEISTGAFYIIQSVPPIRVVIPWITWAALAVLTLVCIGAIMMMVRVVSQPGVGQRLRLNED